MASAPIEKIKGKRPGAPCGTGGKKPKQKKGK